MCRLFVAHGFLKTFLFMSCSGPPLSLASLHLLVPPIRLMSAFLWQVVQQHSVKQYDKLVDFISLATEMVPEILSPSQKTQLILGLRARVRSYSNLCSSFLLTLLNLNVTDSNTYFFVTSFSFYDMVPVTVCILLQLVLELCRDDGIANLQTIQSHLDKIHSHSVELSSTDQKVGF